MQKSSQEDRILARLKSGGAEWTPAPELARISLQYAARLHSLRHDRGIEIENRVENTGGVKHGFYRLMQPATQASLFGGISPEGFPEYPD